MPHERLEEAQVALQIGGGFVGHGDVQQNILAVALLADLGRQSALALDFHLIHVAAGITDPAFNLLDDAVERGLVQFGLDDANQFVFTHEENLLSMGLLPFAPWAGWERKETQVVS